MKAHIIRIGNSKGLRLPKAILRQCRLDDTVELEVEDDRVIIRPERKVRRGWDQAFATMAAQGGDALLDELDKLAAQRVLGVLQEMFAP